MENVFEALRDNEKHDQYMDRVEFFLSLKKEAGARSVARDETRKLLESKGSSSAKLKSRLSGKMHKAPNIGKNYSDSAQAAGRSTKSVEMSEIKKPSASVAKVDAKTPSAKNLNKEKLKKLLAKSQKA